MPTGLLDSTEIGIPCPECAHETKKSFGWIKAHSDFTCSGCGRNIHMDRDQFLGELRKTDAAIDDLKRSIERFNKR